MMRWGGGTGRACVPCNWSGKLCFTASCKKMRASSNRKRQRRAARVLKIRIREVCMHGFLIECSISDRLTCVATLVEQHTGRLSTGTVCQVAAVEGDTLGRCC